MFSLSLFKLPLDNPTLKLKDKKETFKTNRPNTIFFFFCLKKIEIKIKRMVKNK